MDVASLSTLCNVLVKRVCMDVASLSTLKCSSEKGMYGCGIFIDLM